MAYFEEQTTRVKAVYFPCMHWCGDMENSGDPNHTWGNHFTGRWYYYPTDFCCICNRRIKFGKRPENIIVPGNDLTVGIVMAIISALFFFQRFGTQSIGKAFGPIMAIWFSMLLVMGGMQIMHYPDVLKAVSPHYGYELLTRYPQGFWLLGAVFLCTTGAEALYSDLGHCGIKNIRITWIFVKISLVINYIGQAAWIMHQQNTTS